MALVEWLRDKWDSLLVPVRNIRFCESEKSPYYYSQSIAEFWNTISNVFFFIIVIVYLWRYFGKIPKRFRRNWIVSIQTGLVGVVGIGSIGFHMTMIRLWQGIDELGMVWSIFFTAWFSGELLVGVPSWISVLVVIFSLTFSFLYLVSPSFYSVFLATFIATDTCIGLLNLAICCGIRNSLLPSWARKSAFSLWIRARILSILSFFAFWIPDVVLCGSGSYALDEYFGLELGTTTERFGFIEWGKFHAIGWHVLMAFSVYYRFTMTTFMYSIIVAGARPPGVGQISARIVEWCWHLFPYVDIVEEDKRSSCTIFEGDASTSSSANDD